MSRRRVEIAVLAFGALFLAFVLFQFRPGRRPLPGSGRENLPGAPASGERGQATTVLKGFDYTETVRGKPLFRIQAERTIGFGAAAGLLPNVYALEKVSLTVYPETGNPVTVHADRADYDRRTNAAMLKGNVRWADEHGAVGETAEVSFEPSARAMIAPGSIRLSRGAFVVAARSGRYDVPRHELRLEGPVRGSGTGEDSGGLSSLSADAALYRRNRGEVELIGSVSGASRDGDRLACDRLVLKSAADVNRLDWARAEGHVRGALASRRIPGARGAGAPRPYSGDAGALVFDAAGAVRSLSLTGSPASVEDAARKVHAQTIDIAFQEGQPVSARAQGNVLIDAGKNSGRADRASVGFGAGGEVETLELDGRVLLKGEERSGSADRAIEAPARGVWVLTGEGPGSASAESGGSKISAARIELDERSRSIRAEGNARAVFTPAPGKKNAPTFVGDSSRPTYGKGDRITLDDATRVATLSGRASLWQDASSLFGDDVTLNDVERTLVAVGNVRAVLLPAPETARPPRAERTASVVTSKRVSYRESASEAVFEGTVRVTRGAWRASAEKAVAKLDKDRKLERVELSGDVSMADQATGRTGRADRAVDWPAQEKTVLEGSPAWVVDGEGNRAAGAVLTIAGRGRSVEITAPPGGKTETVHRTRS